MGDLHLSVDEVIKKLEGLAMVGFNLKPDQQRALKELHMGSDLCLMAATAFRKITGYNILLKPEAGALTSCYFTPLETAGYERDKYSRESSRYRLWEIHIHMNFC
jgi:hypothetical protein